MYCYVSMSEFQANMTIEEAGDGSYWTQQRINGNTYIIHLNGILSEMEWRDELYVSVWATDDGSEADMPEYPCDLGSNYRDDPHEELVKEKKMVQNLRSEDGQNFSSWISGIINEAVCELESKQDDEEQFKGKVLAAIEANKEVHEGIDYELGIDR